MKVKPQKTDSYSAEGDASSEDIARRLKLDKGLGFLVRLLDTRVNVLYERLTAQNDITPRQFGVLLTLYQQGTHRGDGSHDEHSWILVWRLRPIHNRKAVYGRLAAAPSLLMSAAVPVPPSWPSDPNDTIS
jgi:hypothetical protein